MSLPKSDKTTKSQLTEEFGVTGLKFYGGVVDEEWLAALKGAKAAKVWAEMRDNDPIVGAVLFAIEMLIRGVEWRVEAQTEGTTEAQFIQECIDDIEGGWPDQIASFLEMLPFGWSIHEIVYKYRKGDNPNDPTKHSRFTDGKLGWRKFAIRAQDSLKEWVWDEERGEFTGMVQSAPPDYQDRTIPFDKALLFRTTSKRGNPEGRSVLRNAYRPWMFKKRMEEIEGVGIERDLAGLPVAYVPPEVLSANATDADRALREQLRKLVTGIRRDESEGILFPLAYDPAGNKLYELTLLSTAGRRQLDISPVIDRYDRRIAQTVLADFILLGHEAVGSFALASSKTNLFASAIKAWLDVIVTQFNAKAIPDLLRNNGMSVDGDIPQLVYGDIETVDLAELGTFITQLAGAGADLFPDFDLENHLRAQAKLPERTEEEWKAAQDEKARAAEEAMNAALAAKKPPVPPNGGGAPKPDEKKPVEKYDPNQPRVPAGSPEGGQWGDGSGSPQPDTKAGKWATPNESTWEKYRQADGSWVEERAALHDRLIEKTLANGKVGHPPTLHFMGGGSAAGKSTMVRSGMVDVGDSVTLDADGFKKQLPDYQSMVATGDIRAASLTHDESSYLVSRASEEAAERQFDVLIDGTGNDNADKVEAKIAPFKAAGYRVVANYATIPVELAVERSTARARDPKSPDFGREVPRTIIEGTHAGVSNTFPVAIERGLFDEANLWDTSGAEPKLIATARGTALDVKDREAWDAFLAKGKVAKAGTSPRLIQIYMAAIRFENPPSTYTLAERALFRQIKREIQAMPPGSMPMIPND